MIQESLSFSVRPSSALAGWEPALPGWGVMRPLSLVPGTRLDGVRKATRRKTPDRVFRTVQRPPKRWRSLPKEEPKVVFVSAIKYDYTFKTIYGCCDGELLLKTVKQVLNETSKKDGPIISGVKGIPRALRLEFISAEAADAFVRIISRMRHNPDLGFLIASKETELKLLRFVAAPESYVASEPFREEHKARMGSLLAGPLLGKFNREGASKPAERKRKRSLPWVALQLLREKKCDAEEAVAQLGSLMVRDTIGLQAYKGFVLAVGIERVGQGACFIADFGKTVGGATFHPDHGMPERSWLMNDFVSLSKSCDYFSVRDLPGVLLMAFKNDAMDEAAQVASLLSGRRHGKKVLVAVNMTSQDLAAAGMEAVYYAAVYQHNPLIHQDNGGANTAVQPPTSQALFYVELESMERTLLDKGDSAWVRLDALFKSELERLKPK